MILLIVGVVIMMFGIFRFTIYGRNFKKNYNVGGFTITAEMISVALFIIGLVLILLFLVNNVQPLFYKGRDMTPNPYGR